MAPIWNLRLYIIWLVFAKLREYGRRLGNFQALFTTPLSSPLHLQPLTGSSTAMATQTFLERDDFRPPITWVSIVSSHFVKGERYIDEVDRVFRSTPKPRSRLPQARKTHPRMERYKEQVPFNIHISSRYQEQVLPSKIHTSSALSPISIVRWTLSLNQFITSRAKKRLGCRHSP